MSVAVIDASAAFIVLPVPEGGHACFCRECGQEVRLVGGQADARQVMHTEGCRVGGLLAEAGKPVYLHAPDLVTEH